MRQKTVEILSLKSVVRSILVCSFIISISHVSIAQPSGPGFRRYGIVDANNVKTVFGNWGVIGQPGQLGKRGAWINASNGYVGDLSFMVGVELVGTARGIHSVITCPIDRPTQIRDQDPITGKYWTFEPDSGYFNLLGDRVAVSSDKSTWPSSWPNRPDLKDSSGNLLWNGILGPEKPAFDQESYYVVDDNNDERFNFAQNNASGVVFVPDSTNLTRHGQGIRVFVHQIESKHPLLNDVLILVYDIENESTHDYSKVVFGQLMGTYVGVTSVEDYREYANDVSVLFKASNLIVSSNFDQTTTNPYWSGQVGKVGHAFVDAPNNNRIASYDCFLPSNLVRLGDDESLWQQLTSGAYQIPPEFQDTLHPSAGGDADYLCGTEYFSLSSGEVRRIAAVLAYGYSNEGIELKVEFARMMWNRQFDFSSALSCVALDSLSSAGAISSTQTVHWSTTLMNGTADLWFSPDAGRTWDKIAVGIPNNGNCDWNTTTVQDCNFGLLRIFVKDSTRHILGYSDSPAMFAIDNPGNGAPTVQIVGMSFPDSASDSVTVSVRIGDPEAQSLILSTCYTTDVIHSWVPVDTHLVSSSVSPTTFAIPVTNLPNSDNFALKFILSDGSLSSADSTAPFHKQSSRESVPRGIVRHMGGQASTPYDIRVVDRARLTGDTYWITFDDTSSAVRKTMSVINQTKGTVLYRGEPLILGTESVPFDGLTLVANDFTTHVDSSGLRWNRSMPSGFRTVCVRLHIYVPPSLAEVEGYNAPCDYKIAFSGEVVDTSMEWPNVAPATLLKCVSWNTMTNSKIKVYCGSDPSWLAIVFVEGGPGDLGTTWDVEMQNPLGTLPMLAGDTLYITTSKGFSYRDTLVIDSKLLGVRQNDRSPVTMRLEQNFPNPFNPVTTIRYQVPVTAHVTLKIFDVLGREVASLVDQVNRPGEYSKPWDASRMASGIYFCRLQVGNFSATRKLLLMK